MPLGTEAAKLERDLWQHATNLVKLRVKTAEIVKVARLNPDLVEVLFHVPGKDDGKRAPMLAWVCRSGKVQIMDGWPL